MNAPVLAPMSDLDQTRTATALENRSERDLAERFESHMWAVGALPKKGERGGLSELTLTTEMAQ